MSISEFSLGLMNRSYYFRRSYHYLDDQEALELVCVLKTISTETAADISERFDTTLYDSRDIPLRDLPEEQRRIIQEEKKWREEFGITKKQADYLHEHYRDQLFDVDGELLKTLS
ncbi:hypothetical protein ACQCVP_23530 [Rossellomorea vietnamensis]|uniref:hypothetical protein n=1 Tax=Rossellomorea vietnamensis TaxID=218284 RepID=UPI003CE9D8A1